MKKLLLAISLLISVNAFSQTSTQNQFSLNLVFPSAEYEWATGENSSLDFMLGINYAYVRIFDESEFGIFPVFQGQYRYYYNFKKRLNKGKRTAHNSANYVTLIGELTSGDAVIGNLSYTDGTNGFIGPAWGLQRVYGKHFKLNLNLGLGYGFNEVDSYLTPIIGFQFGWKFGK